VVARRAATEREELGLVLLMVGAALAIQALGVWLRVFDVDLTLATTLGGMLGLIGGLTYAAATWGKPPN
jgi:hypothetical protein